ncbi:MAG: hypothetical protein OEZ34_12900, partial [Spirochaetia bacterium]|nr:hypothetical protein [Spirochaetia bacterium]
MTRLMFRLFFLAQSALFFFASCRSPQLLNPETFNYENLKTSFYVQHPDGHLPLTINRGTNSTPYVYSNQFLIFSSDKNGGRDIWMRDLTSTVSVPLVSHPSDQHSPHVSSDGKYMVFISENRDIDGDIFLARLYSKPEKIIKQILSGADVSNFWDSSVNLSEKIEKIFLKSENPECRGRASESNPIFSPDQTKIYYLSNRCSMGQNSVWMLEIHKKKIIKEPVRLSQDASQLSMSPDGKHLAYINSRRQIQILETNSGSIRTVDLSEYQNSLIVHPGISDNGEVFFAFISEDTNGDGKIRHDDNASIYSIKLEDKLKKKTLLLESFSPVYNLHYSNFSGGSLVYSAKKNNNINLYLLNSKGIIPRQNSIHEQYLFSKLLKNTDPRRYYLSLESTIRYFSDDRNRRIYEGLVVSEMQRSAAKIKDRILKNHILQISNSILKDNPYAQLRYKIEIQNAQKTGSIHNFLAKVNPGNDKINSPLIARGLHDLAETYFNARRYSECRKYTLQIQKKYPDYAQINLVKLLHAKSDLFLNKRITPDINEISKTFGTTQYRTELENMVFNYYYEIPGKMFAASILTNELKKKDLADSMRLTITTALAYIYFDQNKIFHSRNLLFSHIHKIPDSSPIYIRAWKLASMLFESENNFQGANDAKIRYGSRYTKNSGVSLNKNDFIKIINSSKISIQQTIDTARSISLRIRNTNHKSLFRPAGLIRQAEIPLKTGEQQELKEFCKEGSPSGSLLMLLGKKEFLQQYIQFCTKNRDILNQNKSVISLKDAKNASDLLYLTSYVKANTINILFFNLNKNGLFPELQKDLAITYHRLKIDIAAERNDRLLEWQNSLINLLSPDNIINLITEKDPFDSSIFDDLTHGYKLASEEAKLYHDTAVLYGHAYTLLKKSIAREKFYDSIQTGSLYIPNATLMEKKELTLQNLKNAEYQLQYILYTNPENFEAYILLSWLYQYIDQRRTTHVKRPIYFFEKIFNYLTRTRSARLTDGVFYSQIYKNYFPDRLYEENVDLLQSALQFSNEATPHETAAVHLNLANNYFNLYNFIKSEEHYAFVNHYVKNFNADVFESYKQKALFHYNYGRSFFQNGKYNDAAENYDAALNIYSVNEFQSAK